MSIVPRHVLGGSGIQPPSETVTGALIGNGILTVHSRDQAKKRADPEGKAKGGDAARAALALLDVKARLTR